MPGLQGKGQEVALCVVFEVTGIHQFLQQIVIADGVATEAGIQFVCQGNFGGLHIRAIAIVQNYLHVGAVTL
jgi:stage V sporulation protein SpoVS